MGRDLAQNFKAARAVFDEVDAALGQKLSTTMWEGPKETLTLTENAQPALMAVSMAVIRVLEQEKHFDLAKSIQLVAGHSLGEYSALAATGAFSLADAARLLKLRGQAMQKAVPVGQGAMVALLGVGLDAARKIAADAAQGDVCDIANDNDPTQIVLSGSKAAIDRVAEAGKAHGLRRAIPLPVSAPFHCALMKPAAEAMADALSKVVINKPSVPVVAVEQTKRHETVFSVVRTVIDHRLHCACEYCITANEINSVLTKITFSLLFVPLKLHCSDNCRLRKGVGAVKSF